MSTPFELYQQREKAVLAKAMELAQGAHPAYNISPLCDLIREAWKLGYDIVRKSDQPGEANGN